MKINLTLLRKRAVAACRHYRWAGFTSFACITALAGVLASLQPPTQSAYLAQKLLMYTPAASPAGAAAAPVEAGEGAIAPGAAPAAGQVSPAAPAAAPDARALLSDALLYRTASALELQQPVSPQALRQIVLRPVSEQGDRWLVQFQDSDRERSALVVTAVVEAIAQQDIDAKRRQAEAALRVLQQRQSLLKDKLRVAQARLREFSQREKPVIQQAVDGSLVAAITNIQQQRRALQQALQGTDAELASLQRRLGMNPDQAYVASALSADPAIATLSTQIDNLQAQQQIQSRELQPRHPEMQALQHQQQVYETQLNQRIQLVVGSAAAARAWRNRTLDPARQALATRLVELKSERDRLAQELAILNRAEPELRQSYQDGTALKLDLEQRTGDVGRYREAFEQTEKELAAAELRAAELASDWVSSGEPQVRQLPTWIRSRPVIVLAGAGLGLLAAGATVLLLDVLRGKVLTPEEVQTLLRDRVPLLGVLPAIAPTASAGLAVAKPAEAAPLPLLLDADAPELASYELFRSKLLHHSPEAALKSVILSSVDPGEGKTVSAYNLAIAAARAGKRTLLIEADLRAPSRAERLGVGSAPPAAAALSPEQIQPAPRVPNLFVLSNPGAAEPVSAVLESEQTRQLLQQARDQFEFVVLDATTLRFSDVLVLAPLTDGLILIARPGYTQRTSLRVATQKLAELPTLKLLGAVVNDVAQPSRQTPLLSL